MTEKQIEAVKALNEIKELIQKLGNNQRAELVVLLEKAYQIGFEMPVKILEYADGRTVLNTVGHKLTLDVFLTEINHIKEGYVNIENYKFQPIASILKLMIGVTDYGISQLDEILTQ